MGYTVGLGEGACVGILKGAMVGVLDVNEGRINWIEGLVEGEDDVM